MPKHDNKPSHNPKFHEFVKVLSSRIQSLRKQKSESMEELASECGVTRGTIHKIEHHEANEDISLATIWTIANHFHVDIENLLGGINKIIKNETGDPFADSSHWLEAEDMLAFSLLSELAVLQARADLAEQACLIAKDEKQLEQLAQHSAKLRQKRYSLLLKQRES